MQDRMIEEMKGDLTAINEALISKKDFARLRDAIESDERRQKVGSRRYTPPKQKRRR